MQESIQLSTKESLHPSQLAVEKLGEVWLGLPEWISLSTLPVAFSGTLGPRP